MIRIYTLPNCSQCSEVKEYLDSRNIEWKDIDMSKGGNKKTIEMKKKFVSMGIKNYPVVVWNDDTIIPGFNKDLMDSLIEE